jgi:hypothetical protein
MDRCLGCGSHHGIIVKVGEPWCGICVSSGQYDAFLEAQMLVDAIVAERGRRFPVQRNSAEKQTS